MEQIEITLLNVLPYPMAIIMIGILRWLRTIPDQLQGFLQGLAFATLATAIVAPILLLFLLVTVVPIMRLGVLLAHSNPFPDLSHWPLEWQGYDYLLFTAIGLLLALFVRRRFLIFKHRIKQPGNYIYWRWLMKEYPARKKD